MEDCSIEQKNWSQVSHLCLGQHHPQPIGQVAPAKPFINWVHDYLILPLLTALFKLPTPTIRVIETLWWANLFETFLPGGLGGPWSLGSHYWSHLFGPWFHCSPASVGMALALPITGPGNGGGPLPSRNGQPVGALLLRFLKFAQGHQNQPINAHQQQNSKSEGRE